MPSPDYRLGLGSGRKARDPLLAIVVSIILGSVLVVYPVPYELASWRPLFFLLLMLFWALCQPAWCGIWFAFFLGLASDVMLDAMLGQHALSFVVIAFLVRYFTRNQRVLTFINLWIVVTSAIFLHLLIQLFIQEMAGIQFSIMKHWRPLWSSVLLWPVVYYLLKRWRVG
ncbi:rod shape-determining protein MreD [Alkanindiges sp. WGS2144]|uniref:rod shape-determining protein MreD n=1 Tax=Alkanindiges sp. WGS2144 TaxID=3366808 RepID=UPI003753721B